MTIANRDALIAAMASGYTTSFSLYNSAATITGIPAFTSTWLNGYRRGQIPAEAAVALCTSSTTGAMRLPALGAGNQWYVGGFSCSGHSGPALLMDRLCHATFTSGLIGNMNLAMSLPPRILGAHGVNLYLELTGAGSGGNFPGTFNVTYTNSDGVSARTGTVGSFNGANGQYSNVGGSAPMVLAAGDRGVSSVQSINSTGNWGPTPVFVLARCVGGGTLSQQGAGYQAGFFDLGGTPLGADPCLYVLGPTVATSQPIVGSVRLIQG